MNTSQEVVENSSQFYPTISIVDIKYTKKAKKYPKSISQQQIEP